MNLSKAIIDMVDSGYTINMKKNNAEELSIIVRRGEYRSCFKVSCDDYHNLFEEKVVDVLNQAKADDEGANE